MSEEYRQAYAENMLRQQQEANRIAREKTITYWRELGIEPDVHADGRIWIPDWASSLELIARGRMGMSGLPGSLRGWDSPENAHPEMYDVIKYLAKHHADAAIAIHANLGVPGLVRFANETQAGEKEAEAERKAKAATEPQVSVSVVKKVRDDDPELVVEAFLERCLEESHPWPK